MSRASSDSSMEISPETASIAGPLPGEPLPGADSGIWLDGGVLACACPDCGAPMSIRLWLMVADCFRCGTSIELSEEQEQEALRLLRQQEAATRAASEEAAAAIAPTMLRKPQPKAPPDVPPEAARVAEAAQPSPTVRKPPRRVAASEVYRGPRARVRDLYEKGGAAVFCSDLFKDLPAWLVSLVVHLVAMLLLGMWYESPGGDSPAITLATTVSYEDVEGHRGKMEETPPEAFEFEQPGAVELQNAVQQPGAPTDDPVDLESVDELLNVPNPLGDVADSVVRSMVPVPPAPNGRMFVGRDPKVRAEIVEQAGGTSYTEAAVARGLKFLARHQAEDGRWSLHRFHESPDCDRSCRGWGSVHSDVAATALALLPFLGAGQTHLDGQYTDSVTAALTWLTRQQREDGDLRDGGQMYAHGQATIALCETFAMTGDEQLRGPAQSAVNFIIRAQHRGGGWRYVPGQAGDTSVVGWQLMALKSGQMSYLYAPLGTFEMAGVFLDQVQRDRLGGRYGYLPGHPPSPAMTAEALLCRQYLGWPKDHPGLQSGVEWLLRRHPPDPNRPNIYYWYYATQVMRHFGGTAWEQWNQRMRQVLVETQQKHGHAAGSWDPVGRGNPGGHADRGGRIYMTSLAVCILEVYYRHMPIYGEEVLQQY